MHVKKYRQHHEGIGGHARQGTKKPLTGGAGGVKYAKGFFLFNWILCMHFLLPSFPVVIRNPSHFLLWV